MTSWWRPFGNRIVQKIATPTIKTSANTPQEALAGYLLSEIDVNVYACDQGTHQQEIVNKCSTSSHLELQQRSVIRVSRMMEAVLILTPNELDDTTNRGPWRLRGTDHSVWTVDQSEKNANREAFQQARDSTHSAPDNTTSGYEQNKAQMQQAQRDRNADSRGCLTCCRWTTTDNRLYPPLTAGAHPVPLRRLACPLLCKDRSNNGRVLLFFEFSSHAAAKKVVEASARHGLVVRGRTLTVSWGKDREQRTGSTDSAIWWGCR